MFPRALCRNLRDPGTKKCAYVLNPDRARQKRASKKNKILVVPVLPISVADEMRKARCRGSARRLLGRTNDETNTNE